MINKICLKLTGVTDLYKKHRNDTNAVTTSPEAFSEVEELSSLIDKWGL